MKYYKFFSGVGSKKSLMMDFVDKHNLFIGTVATIYDQLYYAGKISPKEPVLIEAHDYYTKVYEKGETDKLKLLEEDLVCAGNPQIVSEELKRLIEEYDAGCAQFFETEITNYKARKKYFVMHVVKTVDAGWQGKHGSLVVGEKVGKDDHVFRLANDTLAHFVSERFMKEYEKRKLKGMSFLCLTID